MVDTSTKKQDTEDLNPNDFTNGTQIHEYYTPGNQPDPSNRPKGQVIIIGNRPHINESSSWVDVNNR